MTDLGPSSRALLDAARGGLTPDAAALRRVRDKVGATVAGTTAASALAAKLAGLAIVVAIAAGIVTHRDVDLAAAAPNLVLPADGPPVVSRRVPDAAPPAAVPQPAHVEMPADVATPAQRRTAIAPAPRKADLAREVALVDEAMAALRRGDASAALAAARTHARETANAGQLAEDAVAIEIEALCRLHDPAVAARLDAFDAKWPTSAQRSRLSTRCK